MEKQKNRHADYIVIESEKLKNDLAATGVDKEKILVAFNAVNPNEFNIDEKAREEYRREIAVSDDEVLVGYLGSYAFYHDSQRLVLAAQRLKQQGHNNIRILMVGVGKDYNKCHALAQKLGLLDSTIIMKPKVPKEEVPQILASLDIAVLPGSTDIICPIKVQEYMAMELPAVVSDYPANREVIKDGENGVLFKPKNQKLLAEKLLYLAQDAEVRRNIGKKARQEIIEKYTWDKTWGKVLQDIVAALKKTDHSIQ
jgi:glycosyltransferase involved in cell wall biosynthesis